MTDRSELEKRRMPAVGREELVTDRERLKEQFGQLYYGILAVLHRHDPIGIDYRPHLPYPPDEYAPEVDTILLRLDEAHSQHELRRIVYEEFVWWFSNSAAKSWQERLENNDAGPEEKYQEIAQEIWTLMNSEGYPND